jgi:hypothetical protein
VQEPPGVAVSQGCTDPSNKCSRDKALTWMMEIGRCETHLCHSDRVIDETPMPIAESGGIHQRDFPFHAWSARNYEVCLCNNQSMRHFRDYFYAAETCMTSSWRRCG